MRNLIALLLPVALAACAAPGAQTPATPAPTTLSAPTAAPAPTSAPAPTTAPTQPPPVTALPEPSPAPAIAGEPEATIGYGQAQASAFVPGAEQLAVATEAGLLLLGLPELDVRSFTPIAGGAYEIVFSPDGDRVALTQYRDPGQSVVLLGPLGGPPERELPGYRPVFSPDGAALAVSEYEMQSGRTSTRIYAVADGTHTATLIGERARFSPDGSLISTTFNAEALLSRRDGSEVLRLPGFDLAFSPDGAQLARAWEGGAAVYPIRDGAVDVEGVLLNAPGWAREVEFGPDGRLYAAIGAELQTWDVATQREIAPRVPVDDMVSVGPGGLLAASQSIGGDGPSGLTIVRLADGQELYNESPPRGGQTSISAGGELAAMVDLAGDVALFSVEQGELARRNLSGYERAAFGADARIALGADTRAELWAAGADAPALRLGTLGLYDGLHDLSLDGPRLVAELNRFSLGTGVASFYALAWDVESGTGGEPLREQGPLTEGAYGFSEMAQPIAWDYDPASGRMAWRDADGTIYLDDGTPEGAARVEGDFGDVRAIALAPGGGRLALGNTAGDVTLIETAEPSQRLVLQAPGGPITGLLWAPDGSAVLARTETSLAWVTGDRVPPLELTGAPGDPARPDGGPLAVSADGATVAVGGAESALIYRGSQEVLRVAGTAEGLALSADGATLLVLRDGRALLYAVR